MVGGSEGGGEGGGGDVAVRVCCCYGVVLRVLAWDTELHPATKVTEGSQPQIIRGSAAPALQTDLFARGKARIDLS